VVVRPVNEESTSGYALLRDAAGEPALVLRVTQPRTLYARGRQVVWYTLGTVLGAGLVFGAVALLVLEKLVLSRVGRLSASLDTFAARRDLTARVPVGGRDELARLAGAINGLLNAVEQMQVERVRMAEDLRDVDRQREEFLSLVSHELRHPVAAIGLMAEGLGSTPGLGEKERLALRRLRQQAQSLSRLAEEVLEVARVESGGVQLHRTTVELGALVDDVAQQTSEPDRLRIELPEQPVEIEADPERLGIAVDNLLRNALKYSPPGTPVQVRVVAATDEVEVEVRDEGIGLSETDLGQLFQKYRRVKNIRASGIRGVGLGLYLTRLLIEAHGGRISAASPGPGLGATFTIQLPRSGEGPRRAATPCGTEAAAAGQAQG